MTSLLNFSSGSTILLVDINSGSVGVGLVGIKKGSEPFLVYSARRGFFSDNHDEMFKVLSSVLDDVFKSGVPILKISKLPLNLEKALVVMSAPWIDSIHHEHTLDSDEEFSFGSDQIKILLAEHERDHLLKKEADDHHVFENHLVSLSLNGYEFDNSVSHDKVRNVGARVVSSSLPKRIFDRVKSEISKIFGVSDDVKVRSFPFASIKFAPHIFDMSGTRTAVNFSGNHAETIVFENGKLKSYRVFGYGPHSLSHRISKTHSLPLPIAHSFVRLYSQGLLEEGKSKEIRDTLQNLEKEWKSEWIGEPTHAKEIFLISHPEEMMIGKMLLEPIFPRATIKTAESSTPLLTRVIHQLF